MREIAVPSLSVLYFFPNKFPIGSIRDQEEKFKSLNEKGLIKNGFELFINLSNLEEQINFSDATLCELKKIPEISIHINDINPSVFLNSNIDRKLEIVSQLINAMDAKGLVIHASQFRKKRLKIKEIFNNFFIGIDIWIENDDYHSDWGFLPEHLEEIFLDFRNAKFVLDIAHIESQPPEGNIEGFLNSQELLNRLVEIHCSFGNHKKSKDTIECVGYPGIWPNHALYSALGLKPSENLIETLGPFRKVIEGCVPIEDNNFEYLKQEITMFS
jgi:hypothetical protein